MIYRGVLSTGNSEFDYSKIEKRPDKFFGGPGTKNPNRFLVFGVCATRKLQPMLRAPFPPAFMPMPPLHTFFGSLFGQDTPLDCCTQKGKVKTGQMNTRGGALNLTHGIFSQEVESDLRFAVEEVFIQITQNLNRLKFGAWHHFFLPFNFFDFLDLAVDPLLRHRVIIPGMAGRV
jgi:hypothetical protein